MSLPKNRVRSLLIAQACVAAALVPFLAAGCPGANSAGLTGTSLVDTDIPFQTNVFIPVNLGGCQTGTGGFQTTFNPGQAGGTIAVSVTGPSSASRPQIGVFNDVQAVGGPQVANSQTNLLTFQNPGAQNLVLVVSECSDLITSGNYRVVVVRR